MRKVTKKERDLIAFLLQNHHNKEKLITQLNHTMVENMNDGNMGSLRFLNEDESYFGEQIAEITLLDTDKVPVSFAININKNGDLFELDVFKADFSALIEFPTSPYNFNRLP